MEAVKPLVKPALTGLANASRDGARRCSTPLSGTLLLIPLAWWFAVPPRQHQARF
jgi:hypothetical protein